LGGRIQGANGSARHEPVRAGAARRASVAADDPQSDPSQQARLAHLHRIARELGTTPAYLTGETDDPSEGALPAPKAQDIAEQLDAVLVPQVEIGLSMGGGSAIEDWPVVHRCR
jgi:hypothetical protein